jgi:hypothetical protein
MAGFSLYAHGSCVVWEKKDERERRRRPQGMKKDQLFCQLLYPEILSPNIILHYTLFLSALDKDIAQKCFVFQRWRLL